MNDAGEAILSREGKPGATDARGSDPLEVYRGTRVLVTGASGFLGRWVCRLLTQAGADLWLVARDAAALRRAAEAYGFDGTPLILNLALEGAFAEAHRACKPAITFNLSGYGVDQSERDVSLVRRINTELVEEIAQNIADTGPLAEWGGLSLVHVGSAFEYGRNLGVIAETSEPLPETPYGACKLAGTRQIQAVSEATWLRAVTARVCTVYGPGEHSHRLLPSLLRAARTGEPIDLTRGEQERDFTFVEDVAEGLLRLGTLPEVPSQLVNLATGTLTSIRRFVECARDVLGMRPGQVRLGVLPYREDEVWQGRIDVSRLECLLGWHPPTTVPKGIQQTRDFLAQNGGDQP